MTRRQRIVAGVLVVLSFYLLIVPGFWTWLSPTATVVIPASWPHDKDMPLEILLSAWHANYELEMVRFGILPELGEKQLKSPAMLPLVLFKGQHNRTWNRLTLNRFTFPRVRRIPVVVPFERLAAEGRIAAGTRDGFINIRIDYVGNVDEYSGMPGADEISHSGGSRQDFRIVLE
ncbi:MAG: hypothetical protein MUF48_24170 [Pirellulaceae bacterium]|nr:hypothetical protein [Pirellulaceae bacterium]